MIVVSDTSPICYLLLIDQIMILQELYVQFFYCHLLQSTVVTDGEFFPFYSMYLFSLFLNSSSNIASFQKHADIICCGFRFLALVKSASLILA